MARCSGAGGRAWIEVLFQEGLGDGEMAVGLGGSRAAVWRERRRCGPGACCAVGAQARADAAAGRPEGARLASGAGLARLVRDRLKERLSPRAISAELRELGYGVCAETVYRACCANCGQSGLEAGAWVELPRHRGLHLRPPIPLAAADQRAHQRNTPTLAAQRHPPQHRKSPPSRHRRPHQQQAPQIPPLALSPNRLRCPPSRPPLELAVACTRSMARLTSTPFSRPPDPTLPAYT